MYFLAYEDTMQERAIALMGKKMEAAQALEGRFSSEGLVAMCDDGDSMEVALAKSLAERIDLSDMRRNWKKLGETTMPPIVKMPVSLNGETGSPGETELPGTELVAWMRRSKVLVAELAAELGLPQRRVTEARKSGVPFRDAGPWRRAMERLGKTPTTAKTPGRSRAGTRRVSRPATRSNSRKCR